VRSIIFIFADQSADAGEGDGFERGRRRADDAEHGSGGAGEGRRPAIARSKRRLRVDGARDDLGYKVGQ
jgi:hypothetical protein